MKARYSVRKYAEVAVSPVFLDKERKRAFVGVLSYDFDLVFDFDDPMLGWNSQLFYRESRKYNKRGEHNPNVPRLDDIFMLQQKLRRVWGLKEVLVYYYREGDKREAAAIEAVARRLNSVHRSQYVRQDWRFQDEVRVSPEWQELHAWKDAYLDKTLSRSAVEKLKEVEEELHFVYEKLDIALIFGRRNRKLSELTYGDVESFLEEIDTAMQEVDDLLLRTYNDTAGVVFPKREPLKTSPTKEQVDEVYKYIVPLQFTGDDNLIRLGWGNSGPFSIDPHYWSVNDEDSSDGYLLIASDEIHYKENGETLWGEKAKNVPRGVAYAAKQMIEQFQYYCAGIGCGVAIFDADEWEEKELDAKPIARWTELGYAEYTVELWRDVIASAAGLLDERAFASIEDARSEMLLG